MILLSMSTMSVIYSNKKRLAVLILFSNLLTYLNYFLDWPLVRLANLRVPNFIDLKATLESIECAKSADSGLSLDTIYLTCNYVYGYPLIFLGKYLSFPFLNTASYAWILLIFSSTLIAAIANLSINNFKKVLVVVSLIICSPAVSLLFERANIDTVIFILVILSAWLYARKQILFSIIIISFVTLLKFYTLFLLFIIVFLHANKKNRYVFIPITAMTALSVVLDLVRIGKRIPASGSAQFGAGVFSRYFNEIGFYIDKSVWVLIGISVTCSITYLILKYSHHNALSLSSGFNFKSSSVSEVALGWASIVFVSCFLIGFNYDYRLVFLSFAGFLILRFNYSTKKYVWATIYLTSLWGSIGIGETLDGFSYVYQIVFTLFQLVGDISTLLLTSYLLAYFLRSLNISTLKDYLKS